MASWSNIFCGLTIFHFAKKKKKSLKTSTVTGMVEGEGQIVSVPSQYNGGDGGCITPSTCHLTLSTLLPCLCRYVSVGNTRMYVIL